MGGRKRGISALCREDEGMCHLINHEVGGLLCRRYFLSLYKFLLACLPLSFTLQWDTQSEPSFRVYLPTCLPASSFSLSSFIYSSFILHIVVDTYLPTYLSNIMECFRQIFRCLKAPFRRDDGRVLEIVGWTSQRQSRHADSVYRALRPISGKRNYRPCSLMTSQLPSARLSVCSYRLTSAVP